MKVKKHRKIQKDTFQSFYNTKYILKKLKSEQTKTAFFKLFKNSKLAVLS